MSLTYETRSGLLVWPYCFLSILGVAMVLDGRNRTRSRNGQRQQKRRQPLQVVSSSRREGQRPGLENVPPARRPRLSVVPSGSVAGAGRATSSRRLRKGRAPSRRPATSSRSTSPRKAVASRPASSRLEQSALRARQRRQRTVLASRKRRSSSSGGGRKSSSTGLGLRSAHQLSQSQLGQPSAIDAKGSRRRRSLSRRRSPGARAAQWKQRQQQLQPRPAAPPVSPLIYILRLLIVGIGLGVIAGTVLASIDPSLRYETATAEAGDIEAVQKPPSTELVLKREMPVLTQQLQSLIAQNDGLTAGVMVVDLERESYASINANRRFSSASTIKLPILVALLEEADAGNVAWDELLTMELEDIADEAGEMQFQPPGTQFSVLETATEMIRISDNTATNLLIKRLGGMSLLNERFRSWGLKNTALQNLLPDLGGTNTISPKDLVTLLGRVNRGDILSAAGRDRLFQILQTTQTDQLLPQGIGPGATIAHKTGNIGISIGDVGLVTMPSGKDYLIMAMVERPHGDERADQLIRDLSWETYEFLESTEQKSEQLMPTTVPRSNIAGDSLEIDSSIMTTD